MPYQTDDLRIRHTREFVSPDILHAEFPMTQDASNVIHHTRQEIHQILHHHNDRLLVIVGPCSIHDPEAAIEYARRLRAIREELQEDLLIVMRVYFEKPRTTVGWKGLINDPHLNGTFDINTGIREARKLLLTINQMGVPAGTEFLDLISPQYFADLVSWGAIGARTTESQGHRELASGLSCPIGFKNGTKGSLNIAVDAIGAAAHPHHFISLTKAGHSAIFSTTGNEDGHIILRGGSEPNYDAANVQIAVDALLAANLEPSIMIDCSHANSSKQFAKQTDVATDIAQQIATGNAAIVGSMIESHLDEGRQDVEDPKNLKFGVSITDACLGWDDTVHILRNILAPAIRARRGSNA
ncbi:MAG: 3-deoxy-7-phosphoheptulonate synthase [Zetaproteobacteria bacterium]|nr:3-deoxy-7-phosphoheptulonate synthase [Zetaproteobacteria bacterium]